MIGSAMKCFELTIKDHIAHLVLNRPNKRNAMVREFWNELPELMLIGVAPGTGASLSKLRVAGSQAVVLPRASANWAYTVIVPLAVVA